MAAIQIIVWLFIAVFIIYPALAFGVAPFLIPNLRKIRYQDLSPDLQREVAGIVVGCSSKKAILEKIFKLVISRFDSDKALQFKHPQRLFEKDLKKAWETGEAYPCNVQNMALANLLVATGIFKPEDIEIKTTCILVNIHTYLRIRTGSDYVDADPWSYAYGVPLGKYAHGSPFKLKKRNN